MANDRNDEGIDGGRKDPLARIFLIVVAIMLIIGAALALRTLLARPQSAPAKPAASAPARQSPGPDALTEWTQRIKTGIDDFISSLGDRQTQPGDAPAPKRPASTGSAAPATPPTKPPVAAPVTPPADPQRAYATAAAPGGSQVVAVPVDGKWAYDVFFGPTWQKNGQLRYSTHRNKDPSAKAGAQDKVGSNMSWAPNSGQPTSWYFGIVEADHPSHANTRFPGFFMHPPYLPQSMQAGNRLLWEFPWQGGGSGQVRRFDMRVVGWETVKVPAGEFTAVHLEGKLQYVDKDAVKAEVRYAIWYAPRAKQVVRVLWLGRSPDESSAEMIAELASFNAP
jgi:hypothetical protein